LARAAPGAAYQQGRYEARRGVRYAGEVADVNRARAAGAGARAAGAGRFLERRAGELRDGVNRDLASSPEGIVLGEARRARGAYRDSVNRRVAQRNEAARGQWFQRTKRDQAPVAPVQDIPVEKPLPVARPVSQPQFKTADAAALYYRKEQQDRTKRLVDQLSAQANALPPGDPRKGQLIEQAQQVIRQNDEYGDRINAIAQNTTPAEQKKKRDDEADYYRRKAKAAIESEERQARAARARNQGSSNPFDRPANPFDPPAASTNPFDPGYVDDLFATSAHPDHGEAGPITDYYVSPCPAGLPVVPTAEDAWDLMTGVGFQAYAQRGIDRSTWLASVHAAFDRRTVSEHHAGMLFAMGLNANVPWIVELQHGRDAPFARCNREYAVRLYDTITRDSAMTATGEPSLNKRAFVDWYAEDVLPGRAKAQGFHFATTHDEEIDDDDGYASSTSITIGGDSTRVLPLSAAPRGFLTGLFAKAHDKVFDALTATRGFDQVSPEDTDGEVELDPEDVDDMITMYESDLDSMEEQVVSEDDDDNESYDNESSDAGPMMLPDAMTETARPAQWGWNL
jgi:hypothetical protein